MARAPGSDSSSSGASSVAEAIQSPPCVIGRGLARRGRSSSSPNMVSTGGTPPGRVNNSGGVASDDITPERSGMRPAAGADHSLSPNGSYAQTAGSSSNGDYSTPTKIRSRASMQAPGAVPSVTVTWGEGGKVEQLSVSAEGTRYEQHLPAFVNRQCRVTQRKVDMINRNWRFVLKGTPALEEYKAGHPDATAITYFYDTFYGELFAAAPEMRPLFHSSMAVQGRALISMVAQLTNIAVVSPGQTYQSEVIPAIQSLAERHLEYGVTPAHFLTMGQVLLSALEKCTGATGWTPAIADAWLEVFSFLCLIMIPRVVIKMEEAAREAEPSPHRLNPLNLLGLGQRRTSNNNNKDKDAKDPKDASGLNFNKTIDGSSSSSGIGRGSGSGTGAASGSAPGSRRGSRDPGVSPGPPGANSAAFLAATSPPQLGGRRRWSLSGIDLRQGQGGEIASPSSAEAASPLPHEERWQEDGGPGRPSRWRKLGAAIAKWGQSHSHSPTPHGHSHGRGNHPGGGGDGGSEHRHQRHFHNNLHRHSLSQSTPEAGAARARGRSACAGGRGRSGGGDLGTPGTRSPGEMAARGEWDDDSTGGGGGCNNELDVESIVSELRPPSFAVLRSKPEATIAPGLTLKGELKFKSFLRVDGRFEGQVICSSGSLGCLVIGPSGVLVGDILGLNEVMIEGRLEGDVSANTVLLKGNAIVQGAITACILQVDPGVRIHGSVSISSPRASPGPSQPRSRSTSASAGPSPSPAPPRAAFDGEDRQDHKAMPVAAKSAVSPLDRDGAVAIAGA